MMMMMMIVTVNIIMITRSAWQSSACSPPGANAHAKLSGHWTKVHQIRIRRIGIIGGVDTCVALLRSSHSLRNASTQNGDGYANFHRFAPKIGYHSNVPWAIAKKSNWSCLPIYVLFWKFDEDQSSTFWDNWSPMGLLLEESNIGTFRTSFSAFRHARGGAGELAKRAVRIKHSMDIKLIYERYRCLPQCRS